METTNNLSHKAQPNTDLMGVVNVKEIKKSPEEKRDEPLNKIILQKSLKIGLFISAILLLLGFWRKSFFYLIPLPVLTVFVGWKVKIIAEKIQKNHPM